MIELMEVYWAKVLEMIAFIPHLSNIELTLGVLIGTITLWMFVKGFEVFKMACCELGWKSAALGAVPDKGWKEICKVCGSGDGCMCNKD
jgi:hypothetical protein